MRIGVRVLIAVLVFCCIAAGQEFRGRIQGMVADGTGGVAPGVSVVLRNTGTGVEVVRSSNEQGRFVFDYVDPGTYTLSAELQGFKKFIQNNITMQQRGDLTIDVKLEVGAVSDAITVADTPVAVQFNTASRDLTIETKMVRDLPSFTRNPFQLAMLDPTILNRGSALETQPYHHRT